MKRIAIACQKGGDGKSTMTTNLATAFARAGHATAVLDMDNQGTAYRWGKTRRKAEIKAPLVLSVNPASLVDTLDDIEQRGCHVAFIDTAGKGDSEAAKAIAISDFVLIPTQPSDASLQALGLTLDMVDYHKRPAYVFINRCPHNGNDAERAEAIVNKARGNVSGVRIFERKTYKRAMGAGLSVMEWLHPEKKRHDLAAITEVQQLFSFTLGKMGVAG